MFGGYVMPSVRKYASAGRGSETRDDAASLAAARLKLGDVLGDLAWERHWIVCAPPKDVLYELAWRRAHVEMRGKRALVGLACAPHGGRERMPWLFLSREYLGSLSVAGARSLMREVLHLRDPRVMSVEGVVLLMQYRDALYTVAL